MGHVLLRKTIDLLLKIIIGGTVLGAIISLLVAFGQVNIVIGGAILGAMFSLIAVGLNLQYGVTRVLNIAHGEFLMVGAYVTAVVFINYGINPIASLVISGPVVFVLGILIQLAVFRRLVHVSGSAEELESRSLLAAFGLMFIIQNVLAQIFGANPVGVTYLPGSVDILGFKFFLNMIAAAGISVFLSLVMYLLLRFTSIGLAMRATVEQPAGAQLVGINIYKIHAVSFGLGALLAALAGSMLVMIYTTLGPFSGPEYTFIALAIIILGGMGSFVGSLLGGFIVGYVNYAMLTIDPLLVYVVVYLFIIALLIVRPKGLLGR